MKSKTFINLLVLLAILIEGNINILASPLEICTKNAIQKKNQSEQNEVSPIDKSFYNICDNINNSLDIDKILYEYSLEEALKLEKKLSDLKEKLLYEYIKNLGIYEKKLIRKEIERVLWLKLTIDYTLVSYNLELLRYACELKIEDIIKN